MGWLQKLSATYDTCAGWACDEATPLLPIAHTTQQAHIEIGLDTQGTIRSACVIDREEQTTIVPCTEESASRSGKKPVNHPLCDKLQYVAGDFGSFGGKITSGFSANPKEPHAEYLSALREWMDSEHSHPKLKAIFSYVGKGTVIRDLIERKVLPVNSEGQLVKQWDGPKDATPAIFSVLSPNQTPDEAFVRWKVDELNDPVSGVWEDQSLIEAWTAFYRAKQATLGICVVTGEERMLAKQHPAKVRSAGDKAKLISSNDTSGFTFLGRFLSDTQACGVSYEVTQKAHLALQWLVKRQGLNKKKLKAILTAPGQSFVAWCVGGKSIPDPCAGGLEAFGFGTEIESYSNGTSDAGQAYALRLNKAMLGYRQDLSNSDEVVVMGLDAATTGRLAITLYRELKGSEFLDHIEQWHSRCAWPQDYGWEKQRKRRLQFIGAPSPMEIARMALGRTADSKSGKSLLKATIERMAPCIIDGLESHPIAKDIVHSVVRQTCNRLGFERNVTKRNEDQWLKSLGIACAVFRGHHYNEGYQMALEENRTTRDYLYGRLLAIAEDIESTALWIAKERRDTSAARLMQRFSEHPLETWRTIELSLPPYESRIRNKWPGILESLKGKLDEVMCKFDFDEFKADRPLTGEFLLGYHCQRRTLDEDRQERMKKTANSADNGEKVTHDNIESNQGG